MKRINIGGGTVLAWAAKIGGWVEMPATYDADKVTLEDTQNDRAIRTLRGVEASRLEAAIASGRAWAERESDALLDGAERGAWRGTASDATPLVEADEDEERRTLAEAANQAAAARWTELCEGV